MHTWGIGKHSTLGHGGGGDAPNGDAPRAVQGVAGATAVAVGGQHMLALDSAGELWSWGAGAPVGRSGAVDTPARVLGGLEGVRVTAIAAGRRHSVALTASGQVFTWGGGHYGALVRTPPGR